MTDSADSSDAGATGATGSERYRSERLVRAYQYALERLRPSLGAATASGDCNTDGRGDRRGIAIWQQSAAAGWPAPGLKRRSSPSMRPAADQPSTDDHPENMWTGQPDLAEAIRRADQLLDELRTTVAAIGRTQAPDLSAVIYELEVALTPPAACRPTISPDYARHCTTPASGHATSTRSSISPSD